jgi:hypothetical protein
MSGVNYSFPGPGTLIVARHPYLVCMLVPARRSAVVPILLRLNESPVAAGISLSPGLSLAAKTVRGAAAMPPARQHESGRWQESDEATSRQNACGSRPAVCIALAGAPLQQIQLLIQPLGAEPNSGSCNLGQPFCAMMRSIDGRALTGNGPTAVQSHPTKN